MKILLILRITQRYPIAIRGITCARTLRRLVRIGVRAAIGNHSLRIRT